jgi:hypothetical protein
MDLPPNRELQSDRPGAASTPPNPPNMLWKRALILIAN